jgi:uncharacterized protein YjiS (DUF1127 family)
MKMNDYAYHMAETSGSLAGHGILARLWGNWRARKSVAKLQQLDDYMLRDIGITRDQVLWAKNQPLRINASLALEECARQRRFVQNEMEGRS